MNQKQIDPLEFYDGPKPNSSAIDSRAVPFYKAIIGLFERGEKTVSLLDLKENKKTVHTNLQSNDNLSKWGRNI